VDARSPVGDVRHDLTCPRGESCCGQTPGILATADRTEDLRTLPRRGSCVVERFVGRAPVRGRIPPSSRPGCAVQRRHPSARGTGRNHPARQRPAGWHDGRAPAARWVVLVLRPSRELRAGDREWLTRARRHHRREVRFDRRCDRAASAHLSVRIRRFGRRPDGVPRSVAPARGAPHRRGCRPACATTRRYDDRRAIYRARRRTAAAPGLDRGGRRTDRTLASGRNATRPDARRRSAPSPASLERAAGPPGRPA